MKPGDKKLFKIYYLHLFHSNCKITDETIKRKH